MTTSGESPTLDALRAAAFRGDPPADALAEAFATDPALRREFSHGLRDPRPAASAPVVQRLLDDLARRHEAVDDDLLEHGSLAAFTVPLGAHAFDVGAGALIRSYAPPGPAAVLAGTGELVHNASTRLISTSRWLSMASLPGGLRPGRPGWISSAHVRMAHAQVRRAVRRRAADDAPTPVSQLDLVRTWLDFVYVAPRCAEVLGQDLTAREYAEFVRYWQHLGALLGIEPALLQGVHDMASAADLDARVTAVTGAPSEDSRVLTRAGLEALARGLSGVTFLPTALTGLLVDVAARAMHGDELSTALGIPDHGAVQRVVGPFAAVLRAQRRVLRRSPLLWNAMVRVNVFTNERFLVGTDPGRSRSSSVSANTSPHVASAA